MSPFRKNTSIQFFSQQMLQNVHFSPSANATYRNCATLRVFGRIHRKLSYDYITDAATYARQKTCISINRRRAQVSHLLMIFAMPHYNTKTAIDDIDYLVFIGQTSSIQMTTIRSIYNRTKSITRGFTLNCHL